MKIGELGGKFGVDVETIRYYEREGLLPAPARSANGYREYGPGQSERLAFIRHCRALDMSLADIKVLLSLLESPGRDCAHVDTLVDDQLARVRARIKSMRSLEMQLAALRKQCRSPRRTKKCGILNELVAAAHGEACACHESSPRARQGGADSRATKMKRP
jgi:Cd(II)/Pb(II)-responsive transcriptional regulator